MIVAYCVLTALLMVLLFWFGGVLYYRHRRKTRITRAYARALYYNGIISMEELNQWCASLPPDPPEENDGKPA